MIRRMSAKQARDRFAEVLGQVHYGKNIIIVEKQGKPIVAVIDVELYDRMTKAWDRPFDVLDRIWAKNKARDTDQVQKDVTERSPRYGLRPGPRAEGVLKAVLDTNVIVSAIITGKGIPFQLLQAWRTREWDLVISPRLLPEVERVLSVPKIARVYTITRQDITDLIRLFTYRATIVSEHLAIPRTVRDHEDDHILACAKEGEVDYIVSGDQDLLTLTSYERIPILTPAAFAALLKASR